ncbi:DUF2252 family protein [Bdellovibrio sp. HCB185ZH]|uniref:DUF2252 family protein n=1 Tax=Bdellovibrio sp. HCB185ZH TaxID=3394235 RepID=UPI0039A5CE0E
MKAFLLTFALFMFSSVPAHSESFATVMGAEWHYEYSLFDAFRANAPHYWNWLKLQKSPMLSVQGVVVGDPHIQNFGDVQLSSGGREFTLIDIDDGGSNAPFAGDLIRYAAGNQVSPFTIPLSQIFDAYVSGLQGQALPEPEVLQATLAHTDADYFKRQNKYLNKLTEQNHFSAKAKLTPLNKAPASVQNLFQQSEAIFAAAVTGYQILDIGYKTKLSGGSQGLPRFWYLIQKNQERYIIEFKLEAQAATSYYSDQGAPDQRFPYVAQVYRPSRMVYGPFKIVTTSGGQFLMRARFDDYLDFDPEDADEGHNIQDGQKMSLYIANCLGRWHGQQSSAAPLLSVLNYNEFKSFVNSYVNLMTKENNQ